MIRQKLKEYIRSINGKTFDVNTQCNTMGLKILSILHPNDTPTDKVLEIISDLNNSNHVMEFRKLLKKYGKVTDYLKKYKYNAQPKGTQKKSGDFLIKDRKFIQDVIYVVDATTMIGVAPRNMFNKGLKIIASDKLKVSDEFTLWRKVS